MKIISLWGKKGGVGRTTLCLALASAFKARGYKVVVYDADPQLGAVSVAESKELDFQVIPKDGGAELNFKPDIVLVDLPANDSISNFSQSSLIVAPVRPSQLDMASLNKAIEESELEMSILPVFNAWMQNREEHNKFIEDYSDWPKIKNRNVFERLTATGKPLFGKDVDKWAGNKEARAEVNLLVDAILEELQG